MRQLHAITPAEGKIERLSNFLKVKDRKIWLPGLYRGRAHFSLASLWLIGKALISTISLQMLLDCLNSRDLICVSKKSRLLEEGNVLAFHLCFMSTLRDVVKRRVVRSKKRLLGKIWIWNKLIQQVSTELKWPWGASTATRTKETRYKEEKEKFQKEKKKFRAETWSILV